MRMHNPSTGRRMPRFRLAALLSLILTVSVFGIVSAANPASTLTTTNQDLTVAITLSDSGPVLLGTAVDASALATLGDGDVANIMYVVDVSGSMVNPGFNPFQPGLGDCDGDGLDGTAMDAACLGLIALNESLGDAANVNVGLVAFADGAVTADVSPAAGEQTFTSPANVDDSGSGTPDMEQVIRSLHTEFGGAAAAGVGLFTNKISNGFAGATDYDGALTNMNAAFAGQGAGDINTAFFLSDGEPTSFTTGAGSPLQAAVDAGTVVNTFGVGTIAPGSCAPGTALRQIADVTGGTCTEVADPSTLGTVLPALLTQIVSLELSVNGDVVANVAGSEPVSMSIPATDITGALVVGINTVEATATAADGTVVTATVEIEVIDEPPTGSCVESVNPNGRNVPRAGQNSPGQNEDGFYQLLAEDDVWPVESLSVFVTDTGSGTVFGPYAVGTVIKYTETPGGTPREQQIGSANGQAGAVTVHIFGTGDAEVTAVDGSGNVSEPVACLVPPQPK